jgi:hypothetical protein
VTVLAEYKVVCLRAVYLKMTLLSLTSIPSNGQSMAWIVNFLLAKNSLQCIICEKISYLGPTPSGLNFELDETRRIVVGFY